MNDPETFLVDTSRPPPPGGPARRPDALTLVPPPVAPASPQPAVEPDASVVSGIASRTHGAVTFEVVAIHETEPTSVTVQVCGHLDASTAGLLESVLVGQMSTGRVRIRLDLSRLASATRAGLAPVVPTSERCRALGGRLSLAGMDSMTLPLLAGSHTERPAAHDLAPRTSMADQVGCSGDRAAVDAPATPWSLPSRAWDGHVLVRHRHEAEHADALTAWTLRGLDRGERVVRPLPPAGPDPWWRDRGHPRLDAAMDRGQLVFLDPARVADPGDLGRLWAAARVAGFQGVRVAMSPPEPCRAGDESEPAVHPGCEAVERLAAPVSVLCSEAVSSPLQGFSAGHGSRHLTGHPSVIDASAWLQRSPGSLVVAGEVDLCNAATLTDVLQAACADPGAASPDVLEVDCTGWRFVDVAGTRALRESVEPFVRHGGRVVLHGVPPLVVRVLRLLGADEVLDVVPAS